MGDQTMDLLSGGEGRLGPGKQAEGIGLNFFKKNCSFLAGCLP